MTNFQLKYKLSVVFNKIILNFPSAVFLVVFDKILGYYVFSVPKLFIVRLGQKVLKFEYAIEAIIIFIKDIKKA